MSLLDCNIKKENLSFVEEFCKKNKGKIVLKHEWSNSNFYSLSIRIDQEKTWDLLAMNLQKNLITE